MKKIISSVALAVIDPGYNEIAQRIAVQLKIPLVSLDCTEFEFLLVKEHNHIELRDIYDKSVKPFFVDFLNPTLNYRISHGKARKEALVKAVGLKPGHPLRVIDATAGFGRDSFILASVGCSVLMLEQSPIIACLLEDGLIRLKQEQDIDLTLQHINALEYLRSDSLTIVPDVIYLDPMFPSRKKSAKVKKDMQILSKLAGQANLEEEGRLLTTALACARLRVVVKRPKSAPCLNDQNCDYSMMTKDYRFDIYLCKK